MQNDNNDKGSQKNESGCHSSTDSPHIGGKKMSSSQKVKLMTFRKFSSPISRPSISACSSKSIQSKMPAHEYSQEDILKAMNEPDPEMKQIACSNSIEIIVIEDDDDFEFNENFASENASSILIEDSKEIVGSDEYVGVEMDNPEENGNDTSILKDGCENGDDVSGTELGENDSSCTKGSSFDDGQDRSDYDVKVNSSCSPKKDIFYHVDKTVIQGKKSSCPYLKEDIENCVDKDSMLKMYNDLQKKYTDNQEKLRKLKFLEKHYSKVSSSLKVKLMRFRKFSSPISRPSISACSSKSIQSKMPAQEDIEKAMNKSDPEMKQIACSNSIEIIVIEDDDDVEFNENFASENASSILTEDCKEIVGSDEYVGVELDNPEENGNDTSILKNGCENGDDVLDTEFGENDSSSTKGSSFDDGQVLSSSCPYLKEDIENGVDVEPVLKIFNDLQKEYADNKEKNTPEAQQSLNENWVTCTQLALRKLYDFMPEPRSITFENFLIFMQVDFNAVNYNPETDTFA